MSTMRRVSLLACLLSLRCELAPLNEDTGVLEHLRILSVDYLGPSPLRFDVFVADGDDNPRELEVLAAICGFEHTPCDLELDVRGAAFARGNAERVHERAWHLPIELPHIEYRLGDPGMQLVIRVSDGKMSDEMRFSIGELLLDAPPNPTEPPVIDVADDGTLTAAVPGGSVRWFCDRSLILSDRKGAVVRYTPRPGTNATYAYVYALRFISATNAMRVAQARIELQR